MCDVSRETRAAFDQLSNLVRKWNARINLVAPATIPDLQDRHIGDSVQVSDAAGGPVATWLDLGSGGGFPGLVASILRPATRVILVESDARKSTFLRAAARELGLSVTVLTARVECLEPLGADVISARALAPLARLLQFAHPHARPDTIHVFPKGEQFSAELAAARADWRFTEEIIPSKTREGSVILKLRNVRRA